MRDEITMRVNRKITVLDSEIELRSVRASGPGGQKVNKVSSAVHLFFDVKASSLPDECKARLLNMQDRRITADGVVVIKAARFRTREKNRQDALDRLRQLISHAARERKSRKKTRPTLASRQKRLQSKSRRSRIKKLRKPVAAET